MQSKVKKLSSLERLRTAFSHFTLLFTVAFGFLTTLTLIEEPSKTLQPTFATTTVRGPASVTTGTLSSGKAFMSTLEVGCQIKEELKTTSEHIRIKSPGCGLNLKENITVQNMTNRLSATIFMQGNTGFTTDYLALHEGENTILIQSKTLEGQTQTREVTVLRE